MNPNVEFGELANVCAGFIPVDMAAGANAGDYISLKNYERVTVILYKAAGGATEHPILTLREATDVAGTGVQDLAKITRVYTKVGTLTSVGTYTVVTQAAAATYATGAATSQAIIMFDVRAEDLSAGYDCITVNVADVGTTAQLGCLLYILWPPRYSTMPSAIVD